ncbi:MULTISPECIES: zinc-binding alcohol dehydrogenase family protein [Microbacterium]|jgi:NADPH:quinone reductase-like Zn-dependent oxidoreductase|uniref:zinc-binding alcohol dehydrogenase family protein n=1 Tax=Microbacterium TaxID=33882 RepID=UPI001D1716B9|nr:zinc-binding alcohol dehydrogenase family protein [Microbacterium testaceum]MCC4247673.1 zinc-binding alcohol dehydrogenase family protein [Microbacterium testaceum]
MSVHSAAVLPAPRAPLDVVSATVPQPAADEILVRVRAVGINPVDWVIQGTSRVTYRWLRTPAVLGSDVAGEVVAVGSGVTRFRVGQRVFGLATGTDRGRDPLREGAFQEYTVLLERLAAPLPDALSDEQAAVFPLGVSTAACALFQPAHLGLRMPTGETADGQGGVVVVWGGSTSVGMNAIQLARAAGYDVVSTASPRNAPTVRSLGADAVVDYRAATAVDDLVAAIGGRPVVGAVALGAGSTDACIEVLRRTGGTRLAMASTPVSLAELVGRRHLFPAMLPVFTRIGLTTVRSTLRARRAGIRAGFVWGSSLRDDEVGPTLWGAVIPRALADGSLRPMPEPLVVGEGLAEIQGALDRQRAGVSASKLVVRV